MGGDRPLSEIQPAVMERERVSKALEAPTPARHGLDPLDPRVHRLRDASAAHGIVARTEFAALRRSTKTSTVQAATRTVRVVLPTRKREDLPSPRPSRLPRG
jgi:hypothetical protein